MLFTCPGAAARGGAPRGATGRHRHVAVDIHCHVHHPAADEMVKQVGCASGRLRSVLGLSGTLQHREYITTALFLQFAWFGLNPSQAPLEQFDIADAGDMVLADQVRFEWKQAAIGPAVHAREIAADPIDIGACRAAATVKVVRHQQSFGRRGRRRA